MGGMGVWGYVSEVWALEAKRDGERREIRERREIEKEEKYEREEREEREERDGKREKKREERKARREKREEREERDNGREYCSPGVRIHSPTHRVNRSLPFNPSPPATNGR